MAWDRTRGKGGKSQLESSMFSKIRRGTRSKGYIDVNNCKCTILSSNIKDYRSHGDGNSKHNTKKIINLKLLKQRITVKGVFDDYTKD